MKKIKIAHILHAVGGVDVSLRLILENIDSSKFKNVVIHGTNDTDLEYTDNCQKQISEHKLPLYRNINVLKDLKTIYVTIKLLKEEKPDIIHAHSAKGGIIGKISGKLLNIPVLHTPQAYSYLSATNTLKKKVYLTIEKIFSFEGNKILASSNSEKNRALLDVKYPTDRVLVFNNSILPIEKIDGLTLTKTWPDDYICSVGRPSFQKNIELMLDTLFEIKKKKENIHLVLMGVGFHSPNLESVENKIKALNLENNITMLPWTKREDIFNIINDSKLYLSTARYEGLPYSIIESLALGKPIVATDADGNRDLIENNNNGFIVHNEDATKLAECVITLLNDKELSHSFSLHSKKFFLENFNIHENIKKLETIYYKTN